MNLPSEVLNREFVLPDTAAADAEQEQSSNKFRAITTHAVLIGNIGLLLPSNEVSELVENLSICRLPKTPGWFNGVTSVRGNMIPVFDLHELFGVAGNGKLRKLIVVGSGETATAFWVDGMPSMVMVTSDDTMKSRPPLPQMIKEHARTCFLKDDQIWIEWDVEAFFSDVGNGL